LVTRAPDPDDRRLFTLTFTPKGEDIYLQAQVELDVDIAERFLLFDAKAVANIQKVNDREGIDGFQTFAQWRYSKKMLRTSESARHQLHNCEVCSRVPRNLT